MATSRLRNRDRSRSGQARCRVLIRGSFGYFEERDRGLPVVRLRRVMLLFPDFEHDSENAFPFLASESTNSYTVSEGTSRNPLRLGELGVVHESAKSNLKFVDLKGFPQQAGAFAPRRTDSGRFGVAAGARQNVDRSHCTGSHQVWGRLMCGLRCRPKSELGRYCCKVENRQLIFGLLCCCVAFRRRDEVSGRFWMNRYGTSRRRA